MGENDKKNKQIKTLNFVWNVPRNKERVLNKILKQCKIFVIQTILWEDNAYVAFTSKTEYG